MTNTLAPTASTGNSTGNPTNTNTETNTAANPPSQPEDEDPQKNNTPPKKKLINLLRGWPAPALLPAAGLQAAASAVLSDPELAVPVLQYGIDPGFQPLREEVARWLGGVYSWGGAWGRNEGSGGEGGGGGSCGAEGKGGSGGSGGSGGGSETAARGGNITADEITITGGASQALATVLQGFTDPGYTRAVWVVAPCYFMACPIFEDSGFRGRLRAVPEDEAGVDVGVLERKLKECEAEPWENHPSKHPYPDRKLYRHVIYLVATCANPSGKTMPLARRQQLVHLARLHDALIISDDVYDLLQWPVAPTPTPLTTPSPFIPPLPLLSQIDAALPPSPHEPHHHHHHPDSPTNPNSPPIFGHAISNASFSKLVGPGVRTGWLHGSAGFAAGFAATGTNRSGGAASQFAAAVVWRFLSERGEGEGLEAHVEGVVRPALRRRHALMVGEVRRVLVGLGVGVWGGNGVGGVGVGLEEGGGGEGERGEVYGGYFVWLTLPEGVDAEVVAEWARVEEELVVAPGRIFEVAGDEAAVKFPRNLRLSFSWADEEDIVEGVERLGRVVRRVLEGESGVVGDGAGSVDTGEFK
ncbi:pyridoxal phosphate-dependent transferase [Chaetomium tenue]|uniref:Pyridoxal phosphate-dependent transferase n=1 Tax=Chaetomium tenue TaxID=1854479 RepID=A0ACB7PBE3_9PEZI|nr:pyridoxal phosphate-dependent transferase [Chaetomium globosum]